MRSEVFRRALELVDPGITTLGFAGFFGVATSHRRFASDMPEHRLPVLLNASVSSCSGDATVRADDQQARIGARSSRAWGRFKLAAVSSFAFVEATGPVYAAKLLRDALSLKAHKAPNDPAPRLAPELDPAARTTAAETILRAMSLTENFARLVISPATAPMSSTTRTPARSTAVRAAVILARSTRGFWPGSSTTARCARHGPIGASRSRPIRSLSARCTTRQPTRSRSTIRIGHLRRMCRTCAGEELAEISWHACAH